MRKLRKVLSYMVYCTIAQLFPRSYTPLLGKLGMRIRTTCVRGFITQVGKKVNVDRKANISIGDITIGDYSSVGFNCVIGAGTYIGKYVMMAPDCKIYTRNHKYDDTTVPMCMQGNSEIKNVVIEDDVWIAANVIILPGVRIGTGSIIAAGAVVTKDVAPHSVVGGNPAKVIKVRSQHEQ